jgi:hypothetical protein
MSSKMLILIPDNDREKEATGLRYAYRAKTEGWLDDVKVIRIGPSGHAIVKDEEIVKKAKGMKEIKAVLPRTGNGKYRLSERIEHLGVRTDQIVPVICRFMKEGYIPMIF